MEIIKLKKDQYREVFKLAWEVFQEYEAPDYSKEGIESFYNSIHSEEYIEQLKIFGAFENEKLVGIIATRNKGNHIALFFVKSEEQNKGIGRKLFKRICLENLSGKITVNSSPYAVKVYHHLGFNSIDTEKVIDGIKYTPMEIHLENNRLELNNMIKKLEDKDDKVAYNNLLELEKLAEQSDAIYEYFDIFLEMLDNEKSFIRVRGFRLICKNAKWDKYNKIDNSIDKILQELNDEKPTSVRQCLKAIAEIVEYKKSLNNKIKEKLLKINYLNYKDSMQSLIFKDVEKILMLINEREG